MTTSYRYILYCRKSSEDDSKQIQSLETQERILTDLAEKDNLQIVDCIKESKSARTDQNRPLFAQMLARIQAGEADAILVVHTDRLARNFIDAGYIIKMIEAGSLKEVRTQSSLFNNVPSLMYLGFDFVFSSHYSRDLSVKVKAGNDSKLLKGDYPSYAPIGYINIQPGKGIEPDPIRAPFVTRAFDLFTTGEYSTKSLAKQLTTEGFRSRNGKKLGRSAIHRLLTNPEYYGVIRRKSTLYQGNHQPLISLQTFNLVKETISGRSRPRKQKHNFTYRDFLFCNACGCKVTAGITKNKYVYYRCTNGKGNCKQHSKYWNDEHMIEEFSQFFSHFTLDPIRAEESFNLYKTKLLEEDKQKSHSQTAINQQIATLNHRLTKLEDMFLDGRIAADRFDERKKEYKNEMTQLQTLLKQKTTQDAVQTLELVSEIKNQAIRLSEIFENGDDEVKRDLLKSVLWNCDFQDGKITSTRLTKLWKPLENLNKTDDLEKWRKRWDSNPRSLAAHAFQACAIDRYATLPLIRRMIQHQS